MRQNKHHHDLSDYKLGDIVEIRYKVVDGGWQKCDWPEGLIGRVCQYRPWNPEKLYGGTGVLWVEPIYATNDERGPVPRFCPGFNNVRPLTVKVLAEYEI